MGVLKCDTAVADAFVEKAIAFPGGGWYLSCRIGIPASTFAAIIANTSPGGRFTPFIVRMVASGTKTAGLLCGDDTGSSAGLTSPAALAADFETSAATGVFPADAWNELELHYDGAVIHTTLNSVSLDANLSGPLIAGDPDTVQFGSPFANFFPGYFAGQVYYFDNIKIGTTLGGSELFADDFEGTLSGWDTVEGDATIVADPFAPAPPPTPTVLRYGDPPLWRLIVTNRDSDVLTTLDKRATERGFVFSLNQPASATGLVPSDDPEINIPAPDPGSPAFLSHNTRLIYGLRREHRETLGDDPWVCRFAGIVMQLEDVGADTPTSRYTAYDPWAYLMCRPIRQNDGTLAPEGGIVYTDARASDMALDLLANTIAVDGSVYIDASDPYLLEDTDVIDGETVFDRGISVGEAWQQLCETGTIDIVLRPVFDPVNRPGILCELIISKQAGEVQYDAVMGWDRASRSLTDLSRLIDGTRLADVVQFYAGQGGAPVTQQSDAVARADYGDYWAQQFMVGKETQVALVELLALAQLEIRKGGAKSIAFSPAPERSYLALRDYGLGDYVPVWASRNFREPLGVDYASLGTYVTITGPPTEGETLTAEITEGDATPGGAGYLRLYAIPIELDDNGVERPHDLLLASESANSY